MTVSNAGPCTLSLHDALPIFPAGLTWSIATPSTGWSITGGNLVLASQSLASAGSTSVHIVATTTSDRKSTRLNSSHERISYAISCSQTKTHVVVQCPNLGITK